MKPRCSAKIWYVEPIPAARFIFAEGQPIEQVPIDPLPYEKLEARCVGDAGHKGAHVVWVSTDPYYFPDEAAHR